MRVLFVQELSLLLRRRGAPSRSGLPGATLRGGRGAPPSSGGRSPRPYRSTPCRGATRDRGSVPCQGIWPAGRSADRGCRRQDLRLVRAWAPRHPPHRALAADPFDPFDREPDVLPLGFGAWSRDGVIAHSPVGYRILIVFGFAARIERLSASICMAISVCWDWNVRALSLPPLSLLTRAMAVSPSALNP